MDELADDLSKYAEQFRDLVVEHAPEAYQALLRVIQVEAAQELIIGVGLFAASAVLAYMTRLMWSWDEGHLANDWEVGWISSGVLTVFTLVVSMVFLFDIWNYVAFIDPDLALAKRLLDSAGLSP